jgi:hypothetical protein
MDEEIECSDLQFEVVKHDASKRGIVEGEEEILLGSLAKGHESSPFMAFQIIKNRANEDNHDDLALSHYLVGRLGGEVFSIDRFSVIDCELIEGRATFSVIYYRRESQNGEPAPATAFFKLTLTPEMKEVTIRFDQRFLGVKAERPLDPPVLRDFKVGIHGNTVERR